MVIGSGVAGLSVALGLPHSHVLTLGSLGSTGWAQGGIAAAVGPDDTAELHADDTMTVSGGIAVQKAVDALTEGGSKAIERLIDLGAQFDLDEAGELKLGREAGHQRRRIVHADGDATGAEVQRTLSDAAESHESVELLEGWRMLDLLRSSDRVTGVLAESVEGRRVAFNAPGVVLATGGVGQIYRHTTNPVGVTGDGLAAAARVGARLADLEFVQFHPTALAGRDPMPLLTEALRGEGAKLVDDQGRRFMLQVHPDAELAPRDIVARAIWWQHDKSAGALLDAREIENFPSRFPTCFPMRKTRGWTLRRICSRSPLRPTTTWVVSMPDRPGVRRYPGSGRSAKVSQPECMAPTAWRRTRCWRVWCLGLWWLETSRRPDSMVPKAVLWTRGFD